MDVDVDRIMSAAYWRQIDVFHVVCYCLIAAGVVVTFVAFLGCCGAFQESGCMLASFFSCLVLLITTEVVASVWSFQHIDDKVRLPVPGHFSDYVKHEYGVSSNIHGDQSIDYVQQMFKCCGGIGPSDWSTSRWSNATGRRHHDDRRQVPDSCCRQAAAADNHPVACRHVYQAECGRELVRWLDEQIFAAIIATLALVGAQLCCLCLSLALCCGLRRQAVGGYKS
jgi:hypothetical protein